tara:strand:+ start:4805 stop:5812 length:1008 start_codon:yes stop_codon:yes gene_type:complete
MGQGYIRNDTVDNIANGNVIRASDIDGEFDALVLAFDETGGHTHDGTINEGGPITVIGPVQEYVGDGTAYFPKTGSAYNLGKVGASWLNVYADSVTLAGVDLDTRLNTLAPTSTYRYGIPTIYTTAGTGTYAVPVGAKALLITICGAGAGGGGATSTGTIARAGGGGGAGVEVTDFIEEPLAATYSYEVGAGGVGGIAGDGPGSMGGTTNFGTCTAPGGRSGRSSGTTTTTETIGDVSVPPTEPSGFYNLQYAKMGEQGFPHLKVSAQWRQSGRGGNSSFGLGGDPKIDGSTTNSTAGVTGFGSGAGGGGGSSSTSVDQIGGPGRDGIIIVTALY